MEILLLIKVFDKEEYADAFINHGEMYCRTLGDFKRIEDDESRGDKYEAVTDWHQPDKVELVISYKKDGIEHSLPVDKLAGPIIMQHTGYDHFNLFCMYAIKIEEFEDNYETEDERLKLIELINSNLKFQSTINDDVYAFGEFAVVIYKVKDFINTVKTSAKTLNVWCGNGLVEYYDPDTFHGSFKEIEAMFRKRINYVHQNEYRFVFSFAESSEAKIIHIGSLADMAFKIPTREFNTMVVLKLDESKNA